MFWSLRPISDVSVGCLGTILLFDLLVHHLVPSQSSADGPARCGLATDAIGRSVVGILWCWRLTAAFEGDELPKVGPDDDPAVDYPRRRRNALRRVGPSQLARRELDRVDMLIGARKVEHAIDECRQ
jgi:hypothetical protein